MWLYICPMCHEKRLERWEQSHVEIDDRPRQNSAYRPTQKTRSIGNEFFIHCEAMVYHYALACISSAIAPLSLYLISRRLYFAFAMMNYLSKKEQAVFSDLFFVPLYFVQSYTKLTLIKSNKKTNDLSKAQSVITNILQNI